MEVVGTSGYPESTNCGSFSSSLDDWEGTGVAYVRIDDAASLRLAARRPPKRREAIPIARMLVVFESGEESEAITGCFCALSGYRRLTTLNSHKLSLTLSAGG